MVGGLLAYRAISQTTAGGRLNFYPGSLREIGMDGITPVAVLGLVVQNPSDQSFTLKSFVGNVYANGYLIGNVSNFINTVIAPNQATIYNLQVRLSILGVVQDIIAAFNGTGITQYIELKSYANVNNFTIPVNITYKVP